MTDKAIDIGTIYMNDLGNYMFESSIGTMHTGMKGNRKKEAGVAIDIKVYEDDGENIPHFHFISKKKVSGKEIHGCAELCVPTYFPHGTKKSTLSNDGAKALQAFMSAKRKRSSESTNWLFAVSTWKKAHGDFHVPEQPDYRKLNQKLYYRVTDRNGVGIYEALKRAAKYDWAKLKSDPNINWLPVPKVPQYVSSYTSYFTEQGYRDFVKKTYSTIIEYIEPRNIVTEYLTKVPGEIVFEDKFQVVASRRR